MTDDAADAVRRWRAAAPQAVLLDGFHALKHALRFGADLQVAICGGKDATLELAARLAPDLTADLADRLTEVPPLVLRDLVTRVHPTAVAALAARPERRANLAVLHHSPRHAPVVVLDEPRHLGNVGAVVRLAAGFNATGVITTGDLDPWHPHVVRSAAGLHYATAVERLSPGGLPPGPRYVLDPGGKDIRDTEVPDDALIVFGSERHGVSEQLRATAAELVALPMRENVSSYNLATSVGMTLFSWAATSRSPRVPAHG